MFYFITFTHLPTQKAFGYAIARMCSALAEHTPITLVMSKSDTTGEDIFSYYNLPKRFEVIEISTLNFHKLFFLGGRIPFFLRKINFFICMLWTLKIKREDVCYGRDVWAIILLRLKTAKVFLEVHYLSGIDSFSLRMFRCVNKFVVITKYLKNKLISLGYNNQDILVFPSGADIPSLLQTSDERVELKKTLGISDGKQIVGYIGKYKTMGESKGVEDLIAVFPALLKYFPNSFILLVGIDESEKQEVESLFHTLGIPTNNYRIVIHVKHSVALKYMSLSDVLVMNYPNRSHYRDVMSPIKLFEYMASRVPIVTSDLPSIREILDEDEAFFFKVGDKEALLKSLISVLSDRRKADNVSKKAFEKVVVYSWEKRAKAIMDMIKQS